MNTHGRRHSHSTLVRAMYNIFVLDEGKGMEGRDIIYYHDPSTLRTGAPSLYCRISAVGSSVLRLYIRFFVGQILPGSHLHRYRN